MYTRSIFSEDCQSIISKIKLSQLALPWYSRVLCTANHAVTCQSFQQTRAHAHRPLPPLFPSPPLPRAPPPHPQTLASGKVNAWVSHRDTATVGTHHRGGCGIEEANEPLKVAVTHKHVVGQ